MIRQKFGMTFIEVLLVASLFAMVGVTIYATFSSGLRIWNRTQSVGVEEDLNLFLDKFALELRNTYYHTQLPFVGYPKQIIVPTVLTIPADPGSIHVDHGVVDQIGVVEYIFDWDKKQITRKTYYYGQAINDQQVEGKAILKNVRDLELKYYFLENGIPVAAPQAEGVIPSGIEINIEYVDSTGIHRREHIINIPLGV